MKKLTIIIISIGIFIVSCNKDEVSTNNEQGETKISNYNSFESHNTGQNCMGCHKSGGSGEGWFNVASTVYDSLQQTPYANGTVKLFSQANGGGVLKYTIKVDGNGNFYTTQNIDFGTGLFPVVETINETKYMSTAITTGNCTSCHGNITGKIWSK